MHSKNISLPSQRKEEVKLPDVLHIQLMKWINCYTSSWKKHANFTQKYIFSHKKRKQ